MRRFAPWCLTVALAAAACGPEPSSPSAAGSSAGPAGAPTATPGTAGPRAWTPGTPLADVPEGAVLSDQWYEVRDDGRKNAWYHMVWTRSAHDGAATIHDRTEHHTSEVRVMDGMEDAFESHAVTDLERSEAGMLLAMTSVTTIAERTETTTVDFTGAGYSWVQTVGDLTERRSVACAEPLPVDAEAFLAPKVRAGELRDGLELRFASANYLRSALDTVVLRVEGREDVATPAGMARCWRVKETVEGRPGESTWWIDESGVLARLRSGTLAVERTTEDKARTIDASAAAYEITFPADPVLPRVTSFDRCVVEATVEPREGVPLPDIPATPFGREVAREGNVIRLELLAHDDPAATVALPVTDPALAKHLESTNLYSPGHPLVRAAVEEALSDVPEASRADGRTAARAILRWIFRRLRKQSGPVPQPTAPEILACRTGDCSEHAVLFVAMCRSAGLPTRRLSGYAQVGDMWGAHAFCEVWLGKWVGADPTTNELGTRARYVAFGRDEDPDSYPGLVSQRFRGRTTIRTLEFTDGAVTLSSDEAERRELRRDARSGLVLADPPRGWTANVLRPPGMAEIDGPGVAAQVQVSAGVGDLDVALLRQTQFGSGRDARFCGLPALRVAGGLFRGGTTTWAVPWRRRTLVVSARIDRGADEAAVLAALEEILRPTLSGE